MTSRKGKGRPKKGGNQGEGKGGNEPELPAPKPLTDPIAQRKLLIESWKARDELFRQLLGDYTYVSPPSYSVPSAAVSLTDIDSSTADGGTADPGDPSPEDQHLAVLAYGPDPLRPYWTYITAGLCSPWLQEEPDEVSGFGCELMIKSPVDAAWPAQILRSLAFYIFNHAGTISAGVRIGLNAPIKENSDSLLRNLFVWYADEAPEAWYQLPSGGFGIFCAVGMTEDEAQYAESVDEYGTWCIQEVLRQVGLGQVSNPDRASVITAENAERLQNARNFANNFGADLRVRQSLEDSDQA